MTTNTQLIKAINESYA